MRTPAEEIQAELILSMMGVRVPVGFAGSFADFLENALLNHTFNATAYSPGATFYAALYTAAPSDTGGGTEVSTGTWTNYARVAITRNTTNFPAASGGAIANGTIIDFGTATISGGAPTVVAMAILDAAASGNFIGWADLLVNKTINNGDPVSFPVGDLDITLA